jgi:hypothetical protein
MITIDEIWLEHLAAKRDALLAKPYSTEASREVERIDGVIDLFWASVEPEYRDAE